MGAVLTFDIVISKVLKRSRADLLSSQNLHYYSLRFRFQSLASGSLSYRHYSKKNVPKGLRRLADSENERFKTLQYLLGLNEYLWTVHMEHNV